VLGVVESAVSLAELHGFDVDKAYLAALFHDCAKGLSREELQRMCDEGAYCLTPDDAPFPQIWHGPAGAALARSKYGVTDAEVLEAIEHHTLGTVPLSPTLRVLMAADSTEPTRAYDGVGELRALLRTDFKAGLLQVVRNKVADVQARGRTAHPRIFKTLEYLEQE